MPVKGAALAGAIGAVVLGAPALAAAQPASEPTGEESDRFFVDKVEKDGDEDKTLWQGSLTSTSFLHREIAGISDPLTGGAVGTENAAPARYFTDLRVQLDALHIAGKTWDARVDARVRAVNKIDSADASGPDALPVQSGSLSGNEYEIRDLYIVRGSVRTDLTVGRQTVLDIAGIKVDGIRLDYAKSQRWTYLGFAGLYPTRGSRSIAEDYPRAVNVDGTLGKRVLPVVGGLGGAYRTQRTYGAIGVAGIVPLADDLDTGTMEQPRLLLSSNGYWRQSPKLDIFHYGVIDLIGGGGFAFTNVSAGVNYRPNPRLHVNGGYHRVDTETLNVQAQTQLEDRDEDNVGVIQNNVSVTRIASDSARVSVSAALGQSMRWEATVAAAARQRPDIRLDSNGGTDQVIEGARTAEIFFQAVDRRFFGGLRLAGSFARIFALGAATGARTTTAVVRVAASREFKEGRGEWEAEVAYLNGKDESREICSTADISTCYGSSAVQTITVGGTAFYRLKRDWMLIGTAEVARQTLSIIDGAMTVAQPALLSTTGFIRISYRF